MSANHEFNYGIGILGAGHYLPSNIDTNEELCKTLTDITPEWIIEKTGITKRYLAGPEDSASSMSIHAARNALTNAGITADQVDLIIACTSTGDYIFPPVSAKIQAELGAKNAQIFDLNANCAGVVTGLTVASDRMLVDDTVRFALVIGVEMLSPYVNRKDVNTAIYLSDGAGAIVLGQVPKGKGFKAASFHTDSNNYEAVRLRGGGSSYPYFNRAFNPEVDFIEMNGLATWKQAITFMPKVIKGVMDKAKSTPEDVSLFLFHQANYNLIEYIVKKMKQDMKKTYTNVREIGNSGSASMAIVLSDALEKKLIKSGDRVLFAGVGAGFNFGACIFDWS